ncbi:class I SAM-dependent methyltransferase [Ferviditalea candida]|uniref:Class I SAM-dependent methyltransferase n=1 Tax=Ferviditalea candida TaxID=3108399 RepID=A0ABU5ZJP3_9BACL|nr:class I SAM-dependent methyltransferase [Paenibacillaceae bacterium T2]
MIVTTANRTSPELQRLSQDLADEMGLRWVPRQNLSLKQLEEKYGDSQFLLITDNGLRYNEAGREPLDYHPSMAVIRIKRLLKGETDKLIELAEAGPGDRVLDCTAGFGADAIIFSHAVGASGKVTALESELIPYLLVREGLSRYQSDVKELDEAMRRIEVLLTDHLSYLRLLPDRSVDIVYFDPMFGKPVQSSSSMSPLRGVANRQPLARKAVEEAVRVARRKVLLKEHRDSRVFAELGFDRVVRTGSTTAYGVMDL